MQTGGGREFGPPTPGETHKVLYVSLEILVPHSLEKQLDPWGPIASRGRSVLPSVKYTVDE